MIFQNERFVLSDPRFLPFFFPRNLEKECILSAVICSLRKKEVEFEVSGYSIIGLQKSFVFLNCLENRFWTYSQLPFYEGQELSVCFQSIDFSTKACFFSKKKKKIKSSGSILNFLKEKDFLYSSLKKSFLIKGRLLKMTKGGFLSSCFGNPAYIIKSSSFYRLRGQNCYKGWFSIVFPFYGLLSFYLLLNFEKKIQTYSKKYYRLSLSKRCKYYDFKNEMLEYSFLLGKPKLYLIEY